MPLYGDRELCLSESGSWDLRPGREGLPGEVKELFSRGPRCMDAQVREKNVLQVEPLLLSVFSKNREGEKKVASLSTTP